MNRYLKLFFGLSFCFWAMYAFSACAAGSIQVRQAESLFDLYVVVEPNDSVILIDDEVFGTGAVTAETPLRVPGGTRRVEIRHEGYYPFRTTLEYIQPGEVYTLRTTLIQADF